MRFIVTAFSLVSALTGCAPAESPLSGRYNTFNLERAIDHSRSIIDRVRSDSLVPESDNKQQEREFYGHGIDSFDVLASEAELVLADASSPPDDVHRMVVSLMAWQAFFTPYDVSLPPTPLIETGARIVPPPEGVHPFYEKYTNVYVDDYRYGCPILTSGDVPDRAIDKVRETMLKLMRRRDIREALAANDIRVVLRGANERNSDHPGIIGPGGAVPGQPTTYIEEEGVYWTHDDGTPHEAFARLNRHVAVEEFGHSIHASALPFIEPDRDILEEINDAFRTAVRNGYYDPRPEAGKDLLTDPDRAEELLFLLDETWVPDAEPSEDISPGMRPYAARDFRSAEYFAVGLDLMYGVTHENRESKLESVEDMKENDPKLYKLLTDFWDDDGWSPYGAK